MEKQLAIILGDGEMAYNVCQWLSSHSTLPTADMLTRIRGVDEATANKILACLELSATYCVGTNAQTFSEPDDIARRMCFAKYEDQEHAYVLCLDSANHEVGVHEVSMGLVNITPMHPREVFKHALADNAVSIAVVHNHPSGNCEPSPEDISITRVLVAAGKIMQIPVLDHVVLAKSGYKSIRRDYPEIFE